jgi:nickel-dependent lactate racemase
LKDLTANVDPARIVSGIGEQPAVVHLRDFALGGFTSGCVCIAPRLSMQLLRAVQAGDFARAEAIRALFRPLEDLRNRIHPIRVLHAAVSLAGIAETGPILPLLSPIEPSDQPEIARAARELLETRTTRRREWMTLYFAEGSPTTSLTDPQLRDALTACFDRLGDRRRVIALPPDFTRYNSRAGLLTCMTHDYYGDRLTDVMPALGTHVPMPDWQLDKMFPGLPKSLIREHRWREDVVTIGQVPAEYVSEVTEGIWTKPWPAQLNKQIWQGGHDLILSIGQVVPHEVIGMANYNKNLFVGTGGSQGINESHFIGAAYGMERMMGRADTPLRRILNYAQDHFCRHLPLVYVLTVVGSDGAGGLVTRGLYVGDDHECFQRAAELSVQVNFTVVEEPFRKVVVYLDPEEFHSTWLGNKSIYRTRMAIEDGGELIVLAPAVKTFGEDRADRPSDPQVRVPHDARDHAVHAGERRPPPESVRRRAPDPRFVREPLPDHVLPGRTRSFRNRRSRLPLRRSGPDAAPVRSAQVGRRLEHPGRRRAILLHQQPRPRPLGPSQPPAAILRTGKTTSVERGREPKSPYKTSAASFHPLSYLTGLRPTPRTHSPGTRPKSPCERPAGRVCPVETDRRPSSERRAEPLVRFWSCHYGRLYATCQTVARSLACHGES